MNTAAAVRGASPSLALIRAERPYAPGRLIREVLLGGMSSVPHWFDRMAFAYGSDFGGGRQHPDGEPGDGGCDFHECVPVSPIGGSVI